MQTWMQDPWFYLTAVGFVGSVAMFFYLVSRWRTSFEDFESEEIDRLRVSSDLEKRAGRAGPGGPGPSGLSVYVVEDHLRNFSSEVRLLRAKLEELLTRENESLKEIRDKIGSLEEKIEKKPGKKTEKVNEG